MYNEDSIIKKVMHNIYVIVYTLSNKVQVIYENTSHKDKIIGIYNLNSLKKRYNFHMLMDDEIEKYVKNDFENKLRYAYRHNGINGVNNLLV
jgi:hypothetical protein